MLVALEDYGVEAESYIEFAHKAVCVQGTMARMRSYVSAPFARIQPVIPRLKKLTIRPLGNFFGNEPARGGCDRGGWQVTLDTVRTAAAASVDCIFRSNVLAIVRWPSLIV